MSKYFCVFSTCFELVFNKIELGYFNNNRIKLQSNITGGSRVMYYLKNYKYHISNTYDMFRPLSEVIIRYYKDETDKKKPHTIIQQIKPWRKESYWRASVVSPTVVSWLFSPEFDLFFAFVLLFPYSFDLFLDLSWEFFCPFVFSILSLMFFLHRPRFFLCQPS
jgi:hypothetical protein